MVLRIPETLNAVNSENYKVSIRLWPDGLSFSGYIPDDEGSFFSDIVEPKGDVQMVRLLKDVFFENPCLSYYYRSIHIICVSSKYTLAPEGLFTGKEKDVVFSYCFQEDKEAKVLVQSLSAIHSFLIYSFSNEVYEFLMRSIINPVFIHFLSPMLLVWHKKSLTCYPKHLYVVFHPSSIDIVCFEQGELLFLNAFDHEGTGDIVYFIICVCRQLGFNQLEDCLYMCGDEPLCLSVLATVKNYIQQADYLPVQMQKYRFPDDRSLFMDEVILTECGL